MTEHMKSKSVESPGRFVFQAQLRLSELLALSVIFALGVVIFIIHLATWGVEARREAKFLAAVPCVVERSEIRADPCAPHKRFRPEVTIRYEVDGESFTTTTYDRLTLSESDGFTYDQFGAQSAIQAFYPGRATACWVRMDDPTKAVLVKRSTVWGWVFLLIPILLMLSGGTLLVARIYERVFSEEARASAKRRSTRYPTLPNVDSSSTPGVELERRLIPDARSTFAFSMATVGTIIWNLAAWLIFINVLSTSKTRSDFVSSWLFFLIFCGLGVVFACRMWSRYQIERVAGSTDLEISTLPVLPGRKIKFCLFLRGRIRTKRIDVFLKCVEIARYVQGTNTIVHRHEAYSSTLFTKYGVDVPPRQSQLERFTTTIPIGAAPSFVAEHNEIVWKLVLQMEFDDGGTFSRDFGIVVYPFLPKDR
ncbi:MAG: DUF3592 domain-containing protein [Thermoguttaceae bacterium]|jgi:hypothetical protein